jgi:hypothetical protein
MKLNTFCSAAAIVAALAVAAPAVADEINQKTIFTFSSAVELPGKTLPAGTYTFKLPLGADTSGTRHIIQVFNKDESEILTTLMTVPAHRLETSAEPLVMFSERPQNEPPAIQYWFYPNRMDGYEFVYPRQQAMRIAKTTNKEVLSAEGTKASSRVTTISPEGDESAYAERSTASSEPAQTARVETPRSEPPVSVQSGQAEDASAQDARPQGATTTRSMPATSSDRGTQLPQTASNEPILFLLSVASFLGLTTLGGLRRF